MHSTVIVLQGMWKCAVVDLGSMRSVNDSVYGLQAGVFTHDMDKAFYAFETCEVRWWLTLQLWLRVLGHTYVPSQLRAMDICLGRTSHSFISLRVLFFAPVMFLLNYFSGSWVNFRPFNVAHVVALQRRCTLVSYIFVNTSCYILGYICLSIPLKHISTSPLSCMPIVLSSPHHKYAG